MEKLGFKPSFCWTPDTTFLTHSKGEAVQGASEIQSIKETPDSFRNEPQKGISVLPPGQEAREETGSGAGSCCPGQPESPEAWKRG